MSENNYIFDVLGWKAKIKPIYNSFGIYILYHNCGYFSTEELDSTKWGFNYISKQTTTCPFCRNKIPEEIIFLLEMIKK